MSYAGKNGLINLIKMTCFLLVLSLIWIVILKMFSVPSIELVVNMNNRSTRIWSIYAPFFDLYRGMSLVSKLQKGGLFLKTGNKLHVLLPIFTLKGAGLFGSIFCNVKTEYNTYLSMIGLQHICSPSGMHVSLLVLLSNKIPVQNAIWKKLTSLVMLFYAIFVGLTPSIVRVLISYVLHFFARSLNRNVLLINKTISSYMLTIVLFPFWIFRVGLIYSVLCCITISLCIDGFNLKANKMIFCLVLGMCLSLVDLFMQSIRQDFLILAAPISNVLFPTTIYVLCFIDVNLALFKFVFPKMYFLQEVILNIVRALAFMMGKVIYVSHTGRYLIGVVTCGLYMAMLIWGMRKFFIGEKHYDKDLGNI